MALMEGVTIVSLILGITGTLLGINAWRREHRGKRKIDLAEDTLTLFYEAEGIIEQLRSPASFGHEHQDLEREGHESEAQYHARKTTSVMFYRFEKHRARLNLLQSKRFRFKAVFGNKAVEPFDEINGIVSRVLLSAKYLSDLWGKEVFRDDEDRAAHGERKTQQEAIFWSGFSEPDEISQQVRSTVSKIELICVDAMPPRGLFAHVREWWSAKK